MGLERGFGKLEGDIGENDSKREAVGCKKFLCLTGGQPQYAQL